MHGPVSRILERVAESLTPGDAPRDGIELAVRAQRCADATLAIAAAGTHRVDVVEEATPGWRWRGKQNETAREANQRGPYQPLARQPRTRMKPDLHLDGLTAEIEGRYDSGQRHGCVRTGSYEQ